ncbi:MAG: glycosyltransferase family 2 protein [Deltaproteobacteria bacterium]|nr:glycosyltransferase family 2 protein [Deltaproteobacteria bacterium]
MTTASPEISVVIPVYNEASIVQSATEELCRALDAEGLDYELLLAENGSRDSTPMIVDGLAQANPRVRALHVGEPNYGRALRQGILQARGAYVLCDEIDLCDVDFYRRALPLLRSGEAEMVVGTKAGHGALDQRPLLRRAGTKVINGMLRVTLGFKGTDTHGLKAFRREALTPVVQACVVERDMFASEFVIRAGRMGRKVLEIPIVVHEKRKPSINLVRRVPNVLKNVARLVYVIRLKNS